MVAGGGGPGALECGRKGAGTDHPIGSQRPKGTDLGEYFPSLEGGFGIGELEVRAGGS